MLHVDKIGFRRHGYKLHTYMHVIMCTNIFMQGIKLINNHINKETLL